MSISGYYYLHTNGSLIFKPYLDNDQVADFRESSFVRAFWPIDLKDRSTAWRILVEAQALGAADGRIKELAALWGCDDVDAENYAHFVDAKVFRDGNSWCATRSDFVNLQESAAGLGDTALDAFSELAKSLGYQASKMWGHSFSDLLKVKAVSA